MSKKDKVLQKIVEQGVLPLFYHDAVEESVAIIRALYKSGIRVVEFTNRGSAAKDVFEALLALKTNEMPDLYLGIGTITTVSDAEYFIKLGTDFVVAPVVDPEIGQLTHEANLLWIPGCMTPTEIQLARQHNAALIKLFPANILGPSYMSTIKPLFKGQFFMPTGGVSIDYDNLKTWFGSGVCAVGMGSNLVDITRIDLLEERTKQVLELIAKVRK